MAQNVAGRAQSICLHAQDRTRRAYRRSVVLAEPEDLSEAIRTGDSADYGDASSPYTEGGGEAHGYCYEIDAGDIDVGVRVPMESLLFRIERRFSE